jgi:hypothetical protein
MMPHRFREHLRSMNLRRVEMPAGPRDALDDRYMLERKLVAALLGDDAPSWATAQR